ncbi:MAG: hypothetical protein ACTSQ8_26055 [Candidatus Helarchaeota archaeon]
MKMKKYQNGNERPGAGENNSKPIREKTKTLEINYTEWERLLEALNDAIYLEETATYTNEERLNQLKKIREKIDKLGEAKA